MRNALMLMLSPEILAALRSLVDGFNERAALRAMNEAVVRIDSVRESEMALLVHVLQAGSAHIGPADRDQLLRAVLEIHRERRGRTEKFAHMLDSQYQAVALEQQTVGAESD